MAISHPKPVIGLLGAPGSGKSYVAAQLAERGGRVIDADALARQSLETPENAQRLAERWGAGVLDRAGVVDRKAVGRRVFADAAERAWLESLIHPEVGRRRAALRQDAWADPEARFVVEDCPLLLETGLDASCDVLLMVDASEAVRLGRVAARGWDSAELERRQASQASLDSKRRAADYVVRNEGDAAALRAALSDVLRQALPPDSPSIQAG
ncbi:MAG: dephospho-CoA kinase [Planctomycetota bacterium]